MAVMAVACSDTQTPIAPSASLTVSQSHIFEGQNFTISLPENHPQNISVFTPDGEFYIVHSEADDVSLWAFSEPRQARILDVNPSSLTGMKWVNGVKMTTPVFTSKGVYKIYLADNLETEAENTYSLSVDVTYK